MKKQLFFITIILILGFSQKLRAQGLLGGEIRWDCMPIGQNNAGKFVFYLTVYQACYNDTAMNPVLANTQILHSNGPSGNTTMNLLAGYPKDLSPVCNPDTLFAHTGCSTADSISAFNGAYRVFIYADTLALNAVPSASGWTFSWNGGARNRSTNLAPNTNPNMRLRSVMYPYGVNNAYPCFDQAPEIAECPIVMTCNGYPFHAYPGIHDRELDSIVVFYAEPLDSTGLAVSFDSGRTYINSLPNIQDNPNNIPAQLHLYSGTIHITTYSEGGFFVTKKISAYKCGVKVADIFQDGYFQFYSCGNNVSPVFQSPFANGGYIDSIVGGQNIVLNLVFTDTQALGNSAPQSVNMTSFSTQFGAYIPSSGNNPPIFDTISGCLNPPCASLRAAPIDTLPLSDTTLVSTQFSWQTDCGHLATNIGCGNTSNVYSFHFKYWDDYCPVPAYNWGEMKLVVMPKPPLSPPILDSLLVDSINGDVALYWTPVEDSLGSFRYYFVYASLNKNGQYTVLDSLTNVSDSMYLHQGAYGNNQQWFYYIKVKSGVPPYSYLSISSDTLNTFPTVFNNIDLHVDKVYDPYYNPYQQVIVKVKNEGFPSIDSIWFTYLQPDSSLVAEQWIGYLAPGDSMDYTFNQVFISSNNPNYLLCVKADVFGDIDTSNNRNCAHLLLGSVDLSIGKIWDPLQTPTVQVYAVIKNVGFPYIDSAWFSYYQPDSSLVKQFWTGYLASGDSAIFMFNQVFMPSYNPNYTLCVYADVYNDNDLSNNSKCISIPLKIRSTQGDFFQLLPSTPNPARIITMLHYRIPQHAQVQLQVFDVSGNFIMRKQIESRTGNNTYSLDVSHFSNGVYFYRLEYEGQVVNAKFIVLR